MRVNAPGSLFAVGGGSAGLLFPWPARNVRVNSPGPELAGAAGDRAGTGGAFGSADGGALIELNMRVNSPGPGPGWPAAAFSAPEDGVADFAMTAAVSVFRGFSIATGLKTRATSSVRPDSVRPDAGAAPGF